MDIPKGMNPQLRIPPQSKYSLTPPHELINRLSPLLGRVFPLTGKGRTDGSAVRRLIAHELQKHPLPKASSSFTIIPEKEKGVPKNVLEFVDTYIVTSGTSYNLQVWNRIPDSDEPQIECEDGSTLVAKDARLVLVRIDTETHRIRTIIVASPEYIVSNFGSFSRPTIKHQMIISGVQRRMVIGQEDSVLFRPDTAAVQLIATDSAITPTAAFNTWPLAPGEVMLLTVIRDLVAAPLAGMVIETARTKNRGQALERVILRLLGYRVDASSGLEGQYPDLKNQLLEVKIQDSPTVDLGKYTPLEPVVVHEAFPITTEDVRYMIVLMDRKSSCVQGIILMPGKYLADYFSYVDGVSGKCQRTIPMSFFDWYDGMAVYNP